MSRTQDDSGAPSLEVRVDDQAAADLIRHHIKLGQRFVFCDKGVAQPQTGRRARLLGYKQADRRTITPLLDEPVSLPGLTIGPSGLSRKRIACLVSDRDLYRAEEDAVHLYVGVPDPTPGLKITIHTGGALLTERALDLDAHPLLAEHGVHLETLAGLTPGPYTAQLMVDDVALGTPAKFTVAEYQLAPLSARLLTHELDRASSQLAFELEVESFQQPFDRELRLTLLDDGRPVANMLASAERPGRFRGSFVLEGDGPFRVSAQAEHDAERVCEVVLPGSRKRERELSVVSELGVEMRLAMLPEPDAVPVRGAFLTEGDYLPTPLIVDELIAERGMIRIREDVEALTVVSWDLAAAKPSVRIHGDQKAGSEVEVEVPSAMCAVFVGCFVDGQPFEGYTTFFRPPTLPLEVRVADRCRPGDTLEVAVRCPTARPMPVLVSVRDRRLTQANTPQVGLTSSAKAALDEIVEPYTAAEAEAGFRSLGDDDVWARLTPGGPLSRSAVDAGGADPGPGEVLVVVTDKTGHTQRLVFEQDEITIGRVVGNDLVLAKGSVSKRHSRLVVRDDKLIIVDLKSTNGTYVNGKRINAPLVLAQHDTVYLGEFTIRAAMGDRAPRRIPVGGAPRRLGGAPARGAPTGSSRAVMFDADGSVDLLLGDDEELLSDEGLELDDELDGDFDDISQEDMRAGGIAPALAPEPPSALAPAAAADEASQARGMAIEARGHDGAKGGGEAPLMQRLGSPSPVGATAEGAAFDEPTGAGPAPELDVRESFPEVLFYAVVEVDGETTLNVPVADNLGTFSVECFALSRYDWAEQRLDVVVDQPVRADLRVPGAMFPEDVVIGRLRAFAENSQGGRGQVEVEVVCNGETVPLRDAAGQNLEPGVALPSPTEVSFDVRPGLWRATVTDVLSGETDSIETRVDTPHETRSLVREVALLPAGETVNLDDEDALTFRVLPSLKETFTTAAKTTASYRHLCCEQTAAKMLAASLLYLSGEDPVTKAAAEDVLLAGAAREELMYREGRGFSMYPGDREVSAYWSPLTVNHLWHLADLLEVPGLSPQLMTALNRMLQMANDVGRAHRLSRVPKRVRTALDAYRVAAHAPDRKPEVLAFLDAAIDLDGTLGERPEATMSKGLVDERQTLAYGAAAYLALGRLQEGVAVAGAVTRDLNESGRLYSTVDSVAAVAMLSRLLATGVGQGAAELEVNGRRCTLDEALAMGDEVETITAIDAVLAVEVTKVKTSSWKDFKSKIPLRIGFRNNMGKSVKTFQKGDRATLRVELQDGYQEGDLLHVCLPPCMAWVHGGGLVQRFTADFEGRTHVYVDVVVTSDIGGSGKLFGKGAQHFAVAVRNMFEEERAAASGLLKIKAA